MNQFAVDQRRYANMSAAGYLAFVPPALPPDLTLASATIQRLSAADRSLGELAGMGRTLPNPYVLSHTLMRREAVLSSRIEGTQTSLSDLVLFEVGNRHESGDSDVREVYNYVAALQHLIAADRRLPVSLPLLREAHAILMDGVLGTQMATPGEFRRSQNWIGSPGSLIADASFVPPPPDNLWECLDAFEKYIHVDHDQPPLVTLATIHYQFEAIHPFLDGNGRIGRLLIILLLVEWQLLPAPLLDLSAYIEPRRDRYYEALLRVSTHGDWLGWIEFFLEVIEKQARDSIARATQLQVLRDKYRNLVSTARSSGLQGMLVDALFHVPALTIGRAQELLDVTHRAATLNVEKLVAGGILTEIEGRRRPRVFIAREIIRALDGGANAK